MQVELDFNKVVFSGSDYVAELDEKRLTGQLLRLFELMKDGKWRSLHEIESATQIPQASASAQLRNFRKINFIINKRRRGERTSGLFEYQMEIKI